MCTYNTTIALPAEPSKPGYNFTGWQLRQATTFDLSTLAEYISSNGNAYGYSKLNGDTGSNEETYGLTPGRGEWATEFDYGTVKGIALCSSTSGTQHTTGTPDETGAGNTEYCWCKATGFAEPNSNTYTNVASPSWVLTLTEISKSYSCPRDCANSCARFTNNYSDFRSALYGITQ